MSEVKGPIIGTVLLAGINPAGEPKYINGTVLVAGLNASGEMEYLDPDNIGGGSGGGAPVGASYIVGAAHTDLTAELVLGTAIIMTGLASAKPAASLAGRLYYETDTNKLFRDTGSAWIAIGYQDYVYIRDEKAANTAGGTFTLGAWRTRDLNVEVVDTGGHASISANQITLAAGTWRTFATAPAQNVAQHRLRLENITDGTTLLKGFSAYSATSASDGNMIATLRGRFTITAPKVIELQHRSLATKTTDGFGVQNNLDIEIYSEIEFWKEA